MEELQQVLSDKGLSFSILPDKGRCLFTTRDFFPGNAILSEEPCVSVPSKTSGCSRCDWCFTSSNLKRCSSCQAVWYCGSTCQKSDWKLHHRECQALTKLDKNRLNSVTPSIRLMVKLYLRRKLQSDKIIPTTVTDNYNLVEALVSHMSEINEKQLLLYTQMANLVNLILQWPDISIKEIAENFAKVLISYIETAGSTMTRQKALKEQYYFTCTCPRCINLGQYDDIKESSILEGYRCRDGGCNGFLLHDSDNKGFICQQCRVLRDREEIKKIASEVKLMSEKASMSHSSGNNAEASTMYKMIEKLQLKLCHPFSLNLMRTRETIMKISMELQDWREALISCKLTIPVYQRVYPGYHPLLGLQYYACAKLE